MIKYDVENKILTIMSMTKVGYKTEVVFWGDNQQFRWTTGSKYNPILRKSIGDTVLVDFNILSIIAPLNLVIIDKVFLKS